MINDPTRCDGYPNCDCSGNCGDAIKYKHVRRKSEAVFINGVRVSKKYGMQCDKSFKLCHSKKCIMIGKCKLSPK